MKINITNIVVQSHFNVPLNLHQLVYKLRDAVYKPHKFSAIIWHDKRVGGSCLLFNNGKIVCHGAKSMTQAKLYTRRYARILQKLGYFIQIRRIQLVTASLLVDVGQRIDLNKVPEVLKGASYESELFNAATYRQNRIHFSIFASGKVIVTGIKDLSRMYEEVGATLLELSLGL